MFEIYMLLYVFAVLGVTYATMKHYGLWIKSPEAQLEEKSQLTEQVMRTLHGLSCPICGSRDTYIERVDLWKENSAVQVCNKCKQKALWKLENHIWHLIAPYRYLPTLPTTPASSLIKEEEEMKLEFR